MSLEEANSQTLVALTRPRPDPVVAFIGVWRLKAEIEDLETEKMFSLPAHPGG